jgi:hypothetical protein
MAMICLCLSLGSEPRDEVGGLGVAVVQITRAACSEDTNGVAAVARVEVTEAVGELGLEGLEALDLAAGLFELGEVGFAHQAHRGGGRRLGLPLADDALDVGEREPELLQLGDPPDANEGVGTEEAVPPLRPGVRDEQPELFVEVDRPDGLLGGLGEVADLQQVSVEDLTIRFVGQTDADSTRHRGRLGRRDQRQVARSGGHGGLSVRQVWERLFCRENGEEGGRSPIGTTARGPWDGLSTRTLT